MKVEEFIKNICLIFCLQQMEFYQGQMPENSDRSKNGEEQKVEAKKPEERKKITSKQLLDAPLVLDQQCLVDFFTIKRQVHHASNQQIIKVALKMGLNQLSLSLDLLDHKLEDENPGSKSRKNDK
jgi:hypothetical protein